jgi:hypothetical protein
MWSPGAATRGRPYKSRSVVAVADMASHVR